MASAKRDRIALITALGALGVVVTLAIFNVSGWSVTWRGAPELQLLFCGIAFFSEFLAFLLAVSIERQWERDKKKAIACLYSLLVCAAVNLVSGHNAWTQFEHRMVQAEMQVAQQRIDSERGQMLDSLAEIDRQLAAVRPPVSSTLGPAARAEARELYEIEVQRLSPRRNEVQRRLDATPLTAEEHHVIDPIVVWVAFALLELMKAVVLWGVGFGFAQIGQIAKQALASAALAAQEPEAAKQVEARPALVDEPREVPPPTRLAQEALRLRYGPLEGRALLDRLEQDNVISMTDVASKHASRPRPGRRKSADAPAAANG